MPVVRQRENVIGECEEHGGIVAIVLSDTHLRHTPPLARSGEPDWYKAQALMWSQVSMLKLTLAVPVLFAGDLFHYWKSCPELINFALDVVPEMYAIPGQHDLPLHDYANIRQSAYWTLFKAGRILNLVPGTEYPVGPMRVWGFPWGFPLQPCTTSNLALNVALVHEYLWISSKNSYPGASEDNHLRSSFLELNTYTTAVYGDNHKPFSKTLMQGWGCHVHNNGGFMRWNSDEVDHRPSVGLLCMDGWVKRHYLNVAGDVFVQTDKTDTKILDVLDVDMKEFLAYVQSTDHSKVNFRQSVLHYIESNKVDKKVSKQVRILLEESHGQ